MNYNNNDNTYQQAQSLQNLVSDIVSAQSQNNTKFVIYRVVAVNDDNTINLQIDGADDRITNVINQTPYSFAVQDQALVMFKDGSRSNCYICAKIQAQAKDLITAPIDKRLKSAEDSIKQLKSAGVGGNGVVGKDGAPGKDGADGADGNKWYVGYGEPNSNATQKALQLAQAELGYYAKQSNSQLDDKTANISYGSVPGYEKYARDLGASSYGESGGPYYNKQTLDWCCTFVDWLLWELSDHNTTIMEQLKPSAAISAGCPQTATGFGTQYHSGTSGIQPGDQIIFGYTEGGTTYQRAHTGIVTKVDNTYIYTIEGNVSEYDEDTSTWDYTVRMVQERKTPIAGGAGTGGRLYTIDGYGRIDYEAVPIQTITDANVGDYYLNTLNGSIWQYAQTLEWVDTGYSLSGGGGGVADVTARNGVEAVTEGTTKVIQGIVAHAPGSSNGTMGMVPAPTAQQQNWVLSSGAQPSDTNVKWVNPQVFLQPVIRSITTTQVGTLASDTEYRVATSVTGQLTITVGSIAAPNDAFYSVVVFTSSGAVPVVTNNSGYTLKYAGDSVQNGVFIPGSGTRYRMQFVFDGGYIMCYIVGVV